MVNYRLLFISTRMVNRFQLQYAIDCVMIFDILAINNIEQNAANIDKDLFL